MSKAMKSESPVLSKASASKDRGEFPLKKQETNLHIQDRIKDGTKAQFAAAL